MHLPLFSAVESLAQTEIDEEFNSGQLDLSRWCPCQIDNDNAPVTFHDDVSEEGTHYAEIVVNDARRSAATNAASPPPIMNAGSLMPR